MLSSGLRNPRSSALLGAAFLMATSAIGPGFITQTTVYTEKLSTSFGFIILCSVLLDIVVQMNIWRVVSVSGMRAQDMANKLLKGSGYLLSFLIVIGGLAFNIGNIAGAALGLQVLFDMDLMSGAIASSAIAILIFVYKEAGKTLDTFAKILGIVMIGLTGYIAFTSHPPLSMALYHTFLPETIDTTAIIILVGGTVGGYISFAGAHRLLDAGVTGETNIRQVSSNSAKAIILASSMRILLFLAALGVVSAGMKLDLENPAASVFRLASGLAGYRIFGVVLWCAAITSVVGSAYTSISFVRTYNTWLAENDKHLIIGFVIFSTIVFLIVGRPVQVLVMVGALNGFILPVALSIILVAAHRKRIIGSYRHPLVLTVSGWVVAAIVLLMSVKTILSDLVRLWD